MTLPGRAEYAEDYGFMMRDAHRRPAQAIRPPAIAWHLGFLRPGGMEGEPWYAYVEDFILAVFSQCARQTLNEGDAGVVEISNLHLAPVRVGARNNEHPQKLSLLRNWYEYHQFEAKRIGEDKPRDRGRYEVVLIGGSWRGHDYWMRFEVFDEYFALTVVLQLPVEPATPTPALSEHLQAVAKFVDRRLDDLTKSPEEAQNRDAPDAVRKATDALYAGIWHDFSSAILERPFGQTAPFCSFDRRNQNVPTENWPALTVFADFRGLIMPVCQVGSPPSEVCPCVGLAPRPHANMQERFSGTSSLIDGDGVSGEMSTARWAESVLPLLMAHETSLGGHHRTPPFEPTEYTFSTFADKHYVYGSGFGPQLEPDVKDRRAGAPLTYVLLCFDDDWREVGRTVMRLHTLGMLRLAAIFELRKLMLRDETLLRLEAELREVDSVRTAEDLRKRRLRALQDLRNSLEAVGSIAPEFHRFTELSEPIGEQALIEENARHTWYLAPKRYFDRKWRKRRVTKIHGILQKKKKEVEFALSSADNSYDFLQERLRKLRTAIRCCKIYVDSNTREAFRRTVLYLVRKALSRMDAGVKDGGITYRANRSDYARELFESLAKGLHIGPIRGYQQYNVFVLHRLERAWGLLQAIDARYQQISRLENMLRGRLHGEQLVKHQKRLSTLQTAAEFTFWIVLAPYYLGHIAEALAKWDFFKVYEGNHDKIEVMAANWNGRVALTVLIIGICRVAYRYVKDKTTRDSQT